MRASGLTLVEVVVAVALFGIGVTAILGSLALVIRLDNETWGRASAVVGVESTFEAARAACPDSVGGHRALTGIVTVPRAGKAPAVDTLATEIPCA